MKKLLQLIICVASAFPIALPGDSGSASDAVLLTAVSISQAINSMPAKAAIHQPLRIIESGIANIGMFVVHPARSRPGLHGRA
jgi:hypothetical protein